MQPLSPDFQAALNNSYAQFCYVLRIELTTGEIVRFTSYDIQITIDNEDYLPGFALVPAASTSSNELDGNSTGVSGLLTDSAIAHVGSGLFNGATMSLYLINPFQLPVNFSEAQQNYIAFPASFIRSVQRNDSVWEIDAVGFEQRLNRTIGIETSKYCRAIFGDSNCKFDLFPLTRFLSVVSGDRYTINFSGTLEAGQFDRGKVIFESGGLAGVGRGIRNSGVSSFTLWEPLPFAPNPGWQFRAYPGCAHTKVACIEYSNVANFRGESAIPGAQGLAGGI